MPVLQHGGGQGGRGARCPQLFLEQSWSEALVACGEIEDFSKWDSFLVTLKTDP